MGKERRKMIRERLLQEASLHHGAKGKAGAGLAKKAASRTGDIGHHILKSTLEFLGFPG